MRTGPKMVTCGLVMGIVKKLPDVSGGGCATAGLLTEPQTASGVLYFLHIRPVYVFFKQNKIKF